MRDPFANYDEWLERPYQDMIEDQNRFVDWADEEGYDLDNPLEMVKAERAYEAWLEDNEEDKALAAYEAHMDRLEMEMEERDDDWGSDGW